MIPFDKYASMPGNPGWPPSYKKIVTYIEKNAPILVSAMKSDPHSAQEIAETMSSDIRGQMCMVNITPHITAFFKTDTITLSFSPELTKSHPKVVRVFKTYNKHLLCDCGSYLTCFKENDLEQKKLKCDEFCQKIIELWASVEKTTDVDLSLENLLKSPKKEEFNKLKLRAMILRNPKPIALKIRSKSLILYYVDDWMFGTPRRLEWDFSGTKHKIHIDTMAVITLPARCDGLPVDDLVRITEQLMAQYDLYDTQVLSCGQHMDAQRSLRVYTMISKILILFDKTSPEYSKSINRLLRELKDCSLNGGYCDHNVYEFDFVKSDSERD
jgi:hypothetical protein